MTAYFRPGEQVVNFLSLFEAWTYPRALKVEAWHQRPHDDNDDDDDDNPVGREAWGSHTTASTSCRREK